MRSWREVSERDDLSFRSAANAAAPAASRPLSSAILREVRASADAAQLFASLMASESEGEEPRAEAFFTQLVGDPRWATIVAECSENVRRREALYTRVFTWLKTRHADGSSPATHVAKAAVTATSIGLSIPVGFFLADHAGLKVPVAFEPAAHSKPLTVAWTAEATGTKVPIEVALLVDGKSISEVPLRLRATAEDLGLRINPVGDANLTELTASAKEAALSMATTAGHLAALKAPVETITQALKETHTVSIASSKDLDTLTSRVEDVGTALREDRVGRREFSTLTQAFARGGNAMAAMATMAGEGKTITTAAVEPNGKATVAAHWSDGLGTLRRCDLDVEVGDISRVVEIKQIRGSCPTPGGAPATLQPVANRRLRPGDVVHLAPQPAAIVVDAIRRPLWGKSYGLLRLISTSQPPASQLAASPNVTP